MGWRSYFYVDVYGNAYYYKAWCWDFWYKIHPEWIVVAHEPCKIFNKIFIRRFRGNNRGRHWNRKRVR